MVIIKDLSLLHRKVHPAADHPFLCFSLAKLLLPQDLVLRRESVGNNRETFCLSISKLGRHGPDISHRCEAFRTHGPAFERSGEALCGKISALRGDSRGSYCFTEAFWRHFRAFQTDVEAFCHDNKKLFRFARGFCRHRRTFCRGNNPFPPSDDSLSVAIKTFGKDSQRLGNDNRMLARLLQKLHRSYQDFRPPPKTSATIAKAS